MGVKHRGSIPTVVSQTHALITRSCCALHTQIISKISSKKLLLSWTTAGVVYGPVNIDERRMEDDDEDRTWDSMSWAHSPSLTEGKTPKTLCLPPNRP